MASFADFFMVSVLGVAIMFLLLSIFLWSMGHRFRKAQNALLYFPEEPPESRRECMTPEEAGIANTERVAIETSDGVTLRGYLLWPCAVPSACGSVAATAPVPMGSFPNGSGSDRSARSGSAQASGGALCSFPGGTNGNASLVGCGVPPAREANGSPMSPTVSVPPAFVLVYFHGNAGNVGHRLPVADLFVRKLHCAVLMVDYRGFGLSDDAELEQNGLELDAEACLNFVVNDRRLPRDHIYVMGTSLGGAVAIHLAAKPKNANQIAGVVVENTFTSISDMTLALGRPVIHKLAPCPSAIFFVFQYYIKPLVLQIRWYSVKQIQSVPVPMLFLSGKKDELVPPAQMKQLYAAASTGKPKQNRRFVEFSEGMHNNMPLMPNYCETIAQFVAEVEQDRYVDVV